MSERLDTVRVVEAPEGVELALRVAGPGPRAVAFAIDLLVRAAIYSGLSFLVVLGEVGLALVLLSLFAIEWFYPVLFEVYLRGATPGKRVLGLQVLRDDGTPVGWSESLLRNFVRAVDMLPAFYGTGLVSCLLSPDFKRLGDRLAGTVVVHTDERASAPALPEADPIAPPLALTLEEQAALVEFAVRTKSWTTARANELAEHLAPATATGAERVGTVRRLHGLARWIEGAR